MSRCYWSGLLLLKVLLLGIVVVRQVVPSAIGEGGGAAADSYQSLSQGLYDSSDYVVVLNITNFKSTVYGSEHAWLVEFYNSWCGACRSFAPTWKSLARDIYLWRDVVTVAALDCSDDENNPLCREYEIMHYPEVRYYAPNENPRNLGVEVEKGRDTDGLRRSLVSRLRKEQQEGRGGKWPNITPFRSSEIIKIWDGVAQGVKYYFFLFEEADSYLGSEVILDLRDATSLLVRSVTSDNRLLGMTHKIKRFPYLIVYSRDDAQTRLGIRVPTREGTIKVIKEFMLSRGIDIKLVGRTPEELLKVPPSWNTSVKPEIEKTPTEDRLHQADLEATLRFSIGHEIPMIKIIDGERMRALGNYINVLASYFPMKRGNPMFLNTISFVIRSKNVTSGEDFGSLVRSTEQEMSPVYSEKNEWINCGPGTRGYPCGLWTLFHTLTVNFGSKSEQRSEPDQILRAIHGYVKNFFGCADCARHFLIMAEKNNIFDVESADESVMWLWRAHNEVNERLAGEDTKNLERKKIQYPSPGHCRSCRRDDNGQWNETEVLAYLKKKYSYSAISYSGTTRLPSFDNSDTTKLRDERLASVGKLVGVGKFGWDFTIFDISICVVLYVTSAAILILVCIKFAVKRSHTKRRMYIHSILGKV